MTVTDSTHLGEVKQFVCTAQLHDASLAASVDMFLGVEGLDARAQAGAGAPLCDTTTVGEALKYAFTITVFVVMLPPGAVGPVHAPLAAPRHITFEQARPRTFDELALAFHCGYFGLGSSSLFDGIDVGDAAAGSSSAASDARKREVASYYGLTDPVGDNGFLVDMLGVRRKLPDVQLASVVPAGYADMGEDVSDITEPSDVLTNPCNLLVLPKHVHDAFDAGVVAFVPTSSGIVMRILKPGAAAAAGIAHLDGKALHIPKSADGHWPCKRTLGWFAWLAKCAVLTAASPSASASASASASSSSDTDGDTDGYEEAMDEVKALTGAPDPRVAKRQRLREATLRLGLVTREW